VCVSSYAGRLRLNRRHAGEVLIRSLPALPTAGLSLDDLPALMAQCRQQMQHCIDQMDQQLQHARADDRGQGR
jgi:1-acyl-sn-glycerol-3-phosphate acyltransferase